MIPPIVFAVKKQYGLLIRLIAAGHINSKMQHKKVLLGLLYSPSPGFPVCVLLLWAETPLVFSFFFRCFLPSLPLPLSFIIGTSSKHDLLSNINPSSRLPSSQQMVVSLTIKLRLYIITQRVLLVSR